MTEHHKYQRQLAHVRGLDPDTLFEGCQKLCSWLTDGELEQEPHKRKQPCPKCGGEDRFRFAPELDHPCFFCNICRPTGGWDGIALVQEFADVGELDHKEAVQLLAEATGYRAEDDIDVETIEYVIDVSDITEDEPDSHVPTQSESEKTSKFQTFDLTADSHYVWAVQKCRPEIDFPTYQRAGTVGFDGGIAIPMFDNKGKESGHVRYCADGSKKNTAESKSGIVGTDSRDALLQKRQVKTVFKCAGVSDYLVLSKLITENGLEADYYGFTNACGENENPEKFEPLLRPALEGQTVVVIQDNDTTGETGARRWARHFTKYATDVRIIKPPQERNGKSIKDLRDFVAASDNASDVLHWINEAIENAEAITPDIVTTWKQSAALKPSKTRVRPILVQVSEVAEKMIAWLWENKIPLGMLSLITGLAGVGKSFLTVFMTAIITNGRNWPDGKSNEKGSVLFFHGEEGIADTYKKRFLANGADQSRIVFLNGAELVDENKECTEIDVTLAMVDVIESAIKDTAEKTGLPVKMVVIDPISNYWGNIKENSNAEVRSVLKPLQLLAERTGAAFVMIQHLGKGDKGHAQQRVLGSTGIVATCRSVWGVFFDPDDKDKRIFAPIKVNCGYGHTAVSYRIAPPDGTVEIIETEIQKTGNDLIHEQQPANASKRGRPANERIACEVRLMEILKDEDRPASEMLELLRAEGFGTSTIREAKKSLGVESVRDGKTMMWHLPSDSEAENVD